MGGEGGKGMPPMPPGFNPMAMLQGMGGKGGKDPMAMLNAMGKGGMGGVPPGMSMPGLPAPSSSGGGGSSSSSANITTVPSGKKVLGVGTEVRVQGLQARPAENGKTGKILGFD